MLTGLIDAHAQRRRQQLREQGTVSALAHHDPQGLRALDAPAEDGPIDDPIAEYRKRRGGRHG